MCKGVKSDKNGMIIYDKIFAPNDEEDILYLINQSIDELDMLPKERIIRNNNNNYSQSGGAYDEYQYFKKLYLKLKLQK